MDNTVPEEYAAELQLVIEQLGGRKAFGVIRGDKHLRDVILDAVRKVRPPNYEAGAIMSPSAVTEELRQRFASALLVAGVMARFRRDGHKTAEDLVSLLLEDEKFALPGYDHQIEDTRLVTVLVLDFKLLLTVAKWIRVKTDDHLAWHTLPEVNDCPLTRAAYEQLPTLAHHAFNKYPANALGLAYRDVVYPRYQGLVDYIDQAMARDMQEHIAIGQREVYHLNCLPGNKRTGTGVAYVFNRPVDEVLALLPDRKTQEQVATWQIRVPKAQRAQLHIGFHPESMHDSLKIGGVKRSLGVSHGYGACWIGDTIPFNQHYFKFVDRHQHPKSWFNLERLDEGDPFSFVLEERHC